MTFMLLRLEMPFNFADDNTLTTIANNIQGLIHLLEPENSVGIEWFKNNKMIVNSWKFQATIIGKKKKNQR